MAIHRFQVTFPTDSAIPADYVTNTWYFNPMAPPPITDYDNVRDMLADFYTAVPSGGSGSVSDSMAATLNGPALVKAYDMGDSIPRAPVYESTFAFTPGTGNSLPSEVAICFSYQASRESGLTQARRRGRLYIGPLNVGASDAGGRPQGSLILRLARAGRALHAAAESSTTWNWQVYSVADSTGHDIESGWIDNAFDTQRRRGIAPSSRTIFNNDVPA